MAKQNETVAAEKVAVERELERELARRELLLALDTVLDGEARPDQLEALRMIAEATRDYLRAEIETGQ